MTDIILTNIHKRFGDKIVLHNFSACFPQQSTTCLMGKSGLGKTTLLHIIAGLLQPDAGTVFGRPKKIAAVFQEHRLCEDFSPVANLRLVCGKQASTAELEAHLCQLGLENSLYLPTRTLSGGMKRRVAIARAVAYQADLLLLDEALKELDAEIKRQTMDYILAHSKHKTMIMVTHDINEALYLGAQIMHMQEHSQPDQTRLEQP